MSIRKKTVRCIFVVLYFKKFLYTRMHKLCNISIKYQRGKIRHLTFYILNYVQAMLVFF